MQKGFKDRKNNFHMEIIVHPNKKKTEIIGKKDNKIILNIKAKPENNEANNEIIRFFTKNKQYNPDSLKVKIIKGLKSRNKILKFG